MAGRRGGVRNRMGWGLGGRGQYYGVNEIDDFINSFNGVQSMFNSWNQNSLLAQQVAKGRMGIPLQYAQTEQAMQVNNMQNQLYNGLLAGQISPEEYATALDAFGVSPQQRAGDYFQRQQAATNNDLANRKFAADLANMQARYDLSANKARAAGAGGGGSGKSGSGEEKSDNYKDSDWINLRKQYREEFPDMPAEQLEDMVTLRLGRKNAHRLNRQAAEQRDLAQELVRIQAEKARRKSLPQKAPSAAPGASSASTPSSGPGWRQFLPNWGQGTFNADTGEWTPAPQQQYTTTVDPITGTPTVTPRN